MADSSDLSPRTEGGERTLYVVATVHLDTQWRWTIQDTIGTFIPATLEQNFEHVENHSFFVVSFEGAFRYMLMKEYYPEAYEHLKSLVDMGRWRVAGSMLDAPDVNVVSPESLLRHILYGNGFFAREFGRRSSDLFLPDCFGFGFALPSIAAHCGLRGFSAQKFGNWMAPATIPFDIGRWEGPDGSVIVAAIRPEGYGEGLDEDLSEAARWIERLDATGRQCGARVGLMYVGVGDRGGGLDATSIDWLRRSVEGRGPVQVRVDGSDQLFLDLRQEQIDRLPRHRGELLLPTHGTGCLTSQAELKRWNRRNEALAEAAEKAAVIADWLGALPYPAEELRDAWLRFLWHQMHDDLTGTSIPAAYRFSWNDQLLARNRFGSVLTQSVGAIAGGLDTRTEGLPLIVFNPLSVERQDVVEARIPWNALPPTSLLAKGTDGEELAVQILGGSENELDVAFLARVAPLSVQVFEILEGEAPASSVPDVRVTESSLENEFYRVEIDANGDLAGLFDKSLDRQLLAAPAGLELLRDRSARWPAWEVLFDDLSHPAFRRVSAPTSRSIVESGPVRWSLEVRRQAAGSTFSNESRLRYLDWVEANRRKVEEATDGRVGYLHVPDMGSNGIYEFIKWYYPQIRKEGLVVDVRGQRRRQHLPDADHRKTRARTLLGTRFSFSNATTTTPGPIRTTVFHGHMVCLINETSASDGDIFPARFREAGLGPLIGKRTWGGVTGITNRGPLLDGGTVFVPEFGTNDIDGSWIIENEGVAPDIEVENEPQAVIAGGDPQLERGIEELLKKLEAEPRQLPERPADGRPGDGRKDSVGPDRRHADAALHPAKSGIHHLVDVGAEPSLGHDQPHEGEQRHRGERVFHHAVADGDLQQVDRKIEIVAHQQDRDKRHQPEGNRNIHAEIDQNDDRDDGQDADFDGAHAVSSVLLPEPCGPAGVSRPITLRTNSTVHSTALR